MTETDVKKHLREPVAMIKITRGNLLEADAEALVNTVNCVGHMGKGIALQFKKAFPENFRVYHQACRAKEVQPGRMFVFATGSMVNPKYIINFPTKRHWRGKSRVEDIQAGLEDLVETVGRYGIVSLAVPPLGCGLGGLDWDEVRPMIERAFAELPDVQVALFTSEPDLTARARCKERSFDSMALAGACEPRLAVQVGKP